MKKLLGILLIMFAALLCRSALCPAAGVEDASAAETRESSCGALLATENPDQSIPELRLEEHGAPGLVSASGKFRSLNSGSRRAPSSFFRNFFLKGGDTVCVCETGTRRSSGTTLHLQGSGGHLRPIVLRNLRI